jgi:hypothetical protein
VNEGGTRRGDTDPHIHVERDVVEAGADFRNAITLTLGL